MGFGAGGAATFVELKDTPETYVGQSGKLAKVKATEDGIELNLLLSFTDWYAGGVPTDFPWVFEANNPQVSVIFSFSPIVKNSIGQYVVYATFYVPPNFLYQYNLTTKQWHKLASPTGNLDSVISMSPDGTKLAATAGTNILEVYDVEANTWTASPAAPQIAATDVGIQATVWADDNDTVWCEVRANVPPWTVKCFRYVVSTTTWTQFANSLTPAVSNAQGMGITPDGTALYFGQCGADYNDASKYVIATDTYTTPINLGATLYFAYCSDRHRLWYGSANNVRRYVDLADESLSAEIFPVNAQSDKASNIKAGIFELSIQFAWHRNAEPKNMSYSGSGYWKLAEKVLTDNNLVVFKKPADGYAILAIDKVSGFTIPVYLFGTLTLPAGTWEFFYPKDGDYTQLVISGSELK